MARHIIPETIERAEPRRERVSAPAGPVALSLVRSLRPSQWTKNLINFAALMFGQRLQDVHALLYAIAGFAVFGVVSGVVCLVSDVPDRGTDRRHPIKQRRPIAAGTLP